MGAPRAESWWVYVLVSGTSAATYVGTTADAERRLRQHNGLEPGGARRTRAGRPWLCARLHGPFQDRGAAQSAEARLKRVRGRKRVRSDLTVTPLCVQRARKVRAS
ncbi:MAG TPA: GIY-YIG nuclease family protein [Planctomycetota bacterium]|nr:GIY-YIG nuclease family protein [Planctomycetota bacterium]